MKVEGASRQTCATGALSSMNGAARLMKEASPTPTNLQNRCHQSNSKTVLRKCYSNSAYWKIPLHATNCNRPEIKGTTTAGYCKCPHR